MSQEDLSAHPSQDEARAILQLSSCPGWPVVVRYMERRLRIAAHDLEMLNVDMSGALLSRTQGKCEELRAFLTLVERAQQVLEGGTRR